MANLRTHIPISLIVWIILLLILGSVAGPVIRSLATEDQLATNVLLSAIPFVLVFVAIVLAYIAAIVIAASYLNHTIPQRIHRPIELITIAGIVLGTVGMFQPWSFVLYRAGFFVLLIATLAFIFWSHIIPRGQHHHADLGSVSITDFEQSDL